MRTPSALAACCWLLSGPATLPALPAFAQPAPQAVWELIDEYPASAIPGQADATFAAEVERATGGRILVRPIPDAKSGLRTREQLKAVSEGRFAMADSFGGAFGEESPLLLLSSLPFVTASAEEARALYQAARPLYEAEFARRGQKLLFVTPWPPSGIWSASPVTDLDALKALKIRAYDATSAELFARLCTLAQVVSFSDLMPKLKTGEFNAVLSSGDGGAGRELWDYLRNFSDIVYAVPLSFGAVSLSAWNALDAETQAAVAKAGEGTTARQWEAMTGRVAVNFKRMRENGVAINETPPAEVMAVLRGAAEKTLAEWRATAGPEARAVLDVFLKQRR
ncbi:TRAP transporter substrate-binding protein [Bradyrhizobium canariense]|uniref:TRAP-type C4-dicarboxylate transport system, substrate-binding protein n=1 Tax=Bradyrhizobium canariense TaxID=255045 RepID=A0A1H1WP48_9BRAD|nr:TRAP transporter substrate-binding protein [Bradyrhizobium canariense]SDS98440.1 TRAP-type C4-dicarboxylate transport system, substrate-binding protein [Bradyrhizobium canariense]